MKSKTHVSIFLLLHIIFLFSIIFDTRFGEYITTNDSYIQFNEKNQIQIKQSGFWNLTSGPIYIDDSDPNYNWSKTAFENKWCSGSGNWADPYIIENVTIDGQGSGSCITIRDSNSFFIIRNVTVYNAGTVDYDAGIKLENTTNGALANNNCSNNGYYGILLHFNSKNNIISGNTVNNNDWDGIRLSSSSSYNTISGNTANYNTYHGILLSYGNNTTILSNTANYNTYGIRLYSSSSNTISENTACYNSNGIYMYNGSNNFISGNTVNSNYNGIHLWTYCYNNTFSGNTANYNTYGIYLYLLNNNNIISGNTACMNTYEGIYMVNCINNFISGNTANNNGHFGISIERSSSNTLSGNTADNNAQDGIYLALSNNNIISGNTACMNTYEGIYLENCINNVISGNIIKNNGDSGIIINSSDFNIIWRNTIDDNQDGIFIYVGLNNTIIGNKIRNNYVRGVHIDEDSDYNEFTENIIYKNTIGFNIASLNDKNLVYKNFFLNNEIHAFDDGTANKWNIAVIGNYWDNHTTPDVNPKDGIVDSPYVFISGSVGSIDYFPIAEDGAPRVTINLPSEGEKFGSTAPTFNVEIIDVYVTEMWYTIYGGLNYYRFTGNGTINQTAWDALPDGRVTIMFYARDIVGNENFKEVIVIKDTSAGEPENLDSIPKISFGNYYIPFMFIMILSFIILEKKRRNSRIKWI